MKVILPIQTYIKIYQHFIFLNNDLSRSTPSPWEIFTELFFVLLDKNLQESRSAIKKSDFSSGSPEFDKMMTSRAGKKFQNKLKFLMPKQIQTVQEQKALFDKSLLNLPRFSQIIEEEDLKIFEKHSDDLFSIFHLMQEDMRLNVFNSNIIQEGRFSEFLFKFCLKKGPKKYAYAEFYIRENPKLLEKYQKEYDNYKREYHRQVEEAKQQMVANNTNANFKIPSILSEPMIKVPSIYSWVESKLDQNKSSNDAQYLCFFESTRKVCRLFEIFASDGKSDFIPSSKIHPLLTKSKYDMMPSEVYDANGNNYPLF
jgi:hypothetical protein